MLLFLEPLCKSGTAVSGLYLFNNAQYFKGSVLKQIEEEFNSIHSHGKKVKKELIVPLERYCEIQSSNN